MRAGARIGRVARKHPAIGPAADCQPRSCDLPVGRIASYRPQRAMDEPCMRALPDVKPPKLPAIACGPKASISARPHRCARFGEGPFTIRFADLRNRAGRPLSSRTHRARRLRASWMEARATRVAGGSARSAKSLGETPVSCEPGEAALNRPATARQDDKAFRVVASLR